jgi:hypothetical protein
MFFLMYTIYYFERGGKGEGEGRESGRGGGERGKG